MKLTAKKAKIGSTAALLAAAAAAGISFSKPIHTMVVLPSSARELSHEEVDAAARLFLFGSSSTASSEEDSTTPGLSSQPPQPTTTTDDATNHGERSVLPLDALTLPESMLVAAAAAGTAPAPCSARGRKVSWFRLQTSARAQLLDKYADMLSHVHRWPDESNLRLRAFLRWHHERDHFKKCKDISYDARSNAIACIRSLRVVVDPSSHHRIVELHLCMTP